MKTFFKILFFLFLVALGFSFMIHKIPLPKAEKAELLTKITEDSPPQKLSQDSPGIVPADVENGSRQLLAGLTLEQKVGQLFVIGFVGKGMTKELEDDLKALHPGGVLLLERNISDEAQLKDLLASLQQTTREDTGLPLLVAIDQEGGEVCRVQFLPCSSQADIGGKEAAFQTGYERGRALRALGINLNLAPLLDEASPSDFIYERSFKTDIKRIGEMAEALIAGQREAGLLTAMKHFPGYGGISFNPEREELPVLEVRPATFQFQKALEAEPEMVMTVNVVYQDLDPDLPFGLSEKGLAFLKEELGRDILVISDDLSSPVLKKAYSLEGAVGLAQRAGLDLLLVAGFDEPTDSDKAIAALVKEVQEGRVSEAALDRTVLRIIELKQKFLIQNSLQSTD